MLGSPYRLHFLSLLIFALAAVHAISDVDRVEFKVARVAVDTVGGQLFDKEMNVEYVESLMRSITSQTWNLLFGQTISILRKVQKISLSIGQFRADSSNHYIEDHAYDIYLSSEHLEKYKDSLDQEIRTLLTYEIARVLQYSPQRHIPEAYKDGIAAYVVINFGHAPRRWAKFGDGNRWDQNAAVTGQFFYHCSLEYDNFIKGLVNGNGFSDLTGRSIHDVWTDYKTEHGPSCAFC